MVRGVSAAVHRRRLRLAGRRTGRRLAEDDLSLRAEEDQGYQLRFRSVELWEKLRQWLGK